MRPPPPIDRVRAASPRRCGAPLLVAAAGLLALIGAAPRSAAQSTGVGGILLQGIADGELWSTNTTSNLLTRNGGRPAGLGRLELWGAAEPLDGFIVYAQGEGETGRARAEPGNRLYADQLGARYVATRLFVVDAGRFVPIVGTFAERRFSTRNPLIGEPDGYYIDYPLGVKVSGETRHFDYRVGMVSLPAVHEYYVPDPTPRLRPAIGGGVTPYVGFRLGGSFTVGPYLNTSYTTAQLAGASWTHYQQRVVALDLSYSWGYLETHAEAARGSYDVPGRPTGIIGFTYYGETKYTFTPRLFFAARAERNKYPFIRAFGTSWTARLTDFVDGEVGGGYRVTENTLVKMSLRGDRWWVRPGAPGFLGQGGHALAVQVSQAFDVMDWIDRR